MTYVSLDAAQHFFDPSGRWLALGSADGRVRVIDLLESLQCLARPPTRRAS